MSAKRIALLGFHLESNAFAPVSDEQAFRTLCYLAGDDILSDLAEDNPRQPAEISGFCDAMAASGEAWEPVPIVVTGAEPGGKIERGFFAATLEDMRTRLAAAGPLDGVYFSAHGAMVAEGDDDPEGTLFAMVRAVVGMDVPLIATLDLHANISERMVELSDILIAYRTNPHVDQAERAAEAAGLMIDMFNGMKPKAAFIRLPICPPTVTLLTAAGPYADLINYGQEAAGADIANVSVVAGFVYGDTPFNGLAVIVTAKSDENAARTLAADIAVRAWAGRERFRKELTSIDDAVALARAAGRDGNPPVILADVADNPGGGGRGNTTWLLAALHEGGVENLLFGVFHDPALAARASEAGVGSRFDALFNAETESEFSKPLAAPVEVAELHDGKFIGRRGLWAGRSLDVGPAALLQLGGIKIVVISNRKQCADPGLFEMFGLDIAAARAVAVKSRGHFRAGFDEFFGPDQVIEVDAPGLTSPVLSNFAFKGLPRPVYPLDTQAEWAGPPW